MKYSISSAIILMGSLIRAAPTQSSSLLSERKEWAGLDFTPYTNIPAPPGFDDGPHSLAAAAISLPFKFTNQLDSTNVKLYFTFQPVDQAGISFIGPDGQPYHPDASSTTVDLTKIEHSIPGGKGTTYEFDLTTGFNSGRVYMSDGSMTWPVNDAGNVATPAAETTADPNYNVNWGFIEVNVGDDGSVFGNLSFVDFVGLIIGAKLASNSNPNQVVPGMPADGVSQLCGLLSALPNQDTQPWGQLCINTNLRTLSPNKAVSPGGLSTYFDDYINQVFDRFTNEDLILFKADENANHTGRVDANRNLVVDGYSWPKPASPDIYSCNTGPFEAPESNPTAKWIDPILCAAFNRGTLLLPEGNNQINGPAQSTYYQNDVNNQYAKFVHQLELDGRGYALQYDEPFPAGGTEIAGTFSAGAGDPVTSLEISVGGPYQS